jgi:hypothetical protein
MIPIRVLGPKVLVALEPKATSIEASTGMNYREKERLGNIILAQPTDLYDPDEHSRGLVIAVGEKKALAEIAMITSLVKQSLDFDELLQRLDRLSGAPFAVSVGDVVIFSPSSGISLGEQDDGIHYAILHEQDLHAVITPNEVAA